MESVFFQDLGLIPYQEAYQYQKLCQAQLIDWQENPADFKHHFLIFCEHPPTYTLGKSGNEKNRLFSLEELKKNEIAYFLSDRGGDITYHGPGQIVLYFLADLYRFKKDLHWYLRALEEIIILTLQDYHIEAYRVEGFTGVWTKEKGEEKKIAAIGIRVKKWVTLHGAAFNFDVNLNHFQGIIPCNIPDKGVTNFASLANETVCIQEIKDTLKKNFCKTFNILFV